MEIHAPESPVHSFKDFLVHISIVTVGILIALGLEGLREGLHNRHLVRETRENVHEEMEHDRDNASIECRQAKRYHADLQQLVKDLPILAHQPQAIAVRLNAGTNSGYFLAANSWETALSTGVLAHMPTAEVSAYAYAAEGIRRYTELQNRALTQEGIAKAALMSPLPLSAEAQQTALQQLLLFSRNEEELSFVCPQMEGDIERAERASAP